MARRTPEQMAKAAEEKVRLERARVELAQLRLQRKATQVRSQALSTYRAARRDRTTRDWRAKSTSADSAILPDLLTLDARVRQLDRDDGNTRSVVSAFRRNIVGTGIRPSAAVKGLDGKVDRQLNRQLDALWYDWARSPRRCDIERRRTFYDFQRWAEAERVKVGEALIVWSIVIYPVTGKGRLVLQAVEAEQLDRYKIGAKDPVTGRDNEVRGGVEVDEFGAAVAYWIYRRHPYDVIGMNRPSPMLLESERVPASRVCHYFDAERARQTRGVTPLTPVVSAIRDLSQFQYSYLQAARAEACLGVLITSTSTNPLGVPSSSTSSESASSEQEDQLTLQPMLAARLAPGEDVKPFTPARPGGTYEPYVKASKREIAAGSGSSYEQVARDFTGGTYSSQRQGKLEDEREYQPIQELMVNHICQPVWEAFIELAVMNGQVRAPGFHRDRDRYVYCNWRPQAWPWVDPEKDANAEQAAIDMNADTLEAVCSRRGLDWREVLEQRSEEIEFADSLARQRAARATVGQNSAGGVDGSPEGLNGAQITAAVEILEKLGAGTVTAEAARTLLESVGIPAEQVGTMVESTVRDAGSIQQRLREQEQSAPAPAAESTPEPEVANVEA